MATIEGIRNVLERVATVEVAPEFMGDEQVEHARANAARVLDAHNTVRSGTNEALEALFKAVTLELMVRGADPVMTGLVLTTMIGDTIQLVESNEPA